MNPNPRIPGDAALVRLDHPVLASRTGRGITIAIVDSGVHAAHPHVRGVAGGIAIGRDLVERADYVDRLGHGTAVTAVIREKAPGADLFCVKVFDRELSTGADALVRAIEMAIEHGARLVNLSLGTANTDHESALRRAVERARASGTTIVSATGANGRRWLPGSLPGVVAVELDWACDRHAIRIAYGDGDAVWLSASGYPRPIAGVPLERNLRGVSFAVANATGLLARALEASPDRPPVDGLVALTRLS